MRKLAITISPYLLLLLPVFIAVLVLLLNPNQELLQRNVEMRAAFFKVPSINLFEVVLSFFKSPDL